MSEEIVEGEILEEGKIEEQALLLRKCFGYLSHD